jgi:hypothetical protein
MRMRYAALILAVAIGGLATQYGTAKQSAAPFEDTMNIMEMHNHIDKNLPEMVIADLV